MISKEDLEKYLPLLQEKEHFEYLEYVYSVACKSHVRYDLLCLDKFEKASVNKTDFFLLLLTLNEGTAARALNCGKVPGKRIGSMCLKISQIFVNEKSFVVFQSRECLNKLRPLIFANIRDLPIRVIHSFESYFEHLNNSILEFYFQILLSDMESVKFPLLGEKPSRKLYERLLDIHKMIEDTVCEPGALEEKLLSHKCSEFNLNQDSLFRLKQVSNRLGYFPLFKAIELIIESFDQRDKDIVNYCFNIFSDEHMINISEVAEMDNLSRERVRQLRIKNLDKFALFLSSITSDNLLGNYQYNLSSDFELGNIASREEVSFNENFIVWVLSNIYDSYQLIGDVNCAFFKYPASSDLLFIVPKDLYNFFGFNEFIDSIEAHINSKRYYDEIVELDVFVQHFCAPDISQDTFYRILGECRRIVERGYPNIIANSQLLFPANSRKLLPEIIEDIIRANNEPMTANEIANRLNSLYPDLEQSAKKIGSNALRNPRIVAISRSGTYTLAEWDDIEKRGGTIRDLAQEYLDSLCEPIAPVKDICNYIAKYRSNVIESSIKANLLAESNNRFSLYIKDNVSFIGNSNYQFDNSFKIQDKRQGRRTFQESINLVEKFINENGHFPISSSEDPEEARLYRFMNIAMNASNKGTLTPEENKMLNELEQRYSNFKINKGDLTWTKRFIRFLPYVCDNTLPEEDSPEMIWYNKSKDLFLDGKLTQEQANDFITISNYIERLKKE